MGCEEANGKVLGRGEIGLFNGSEIGFGPGGCFIYWQSIDDCFNKMVASTAGMRFGIYLTRRRALAVFTDRMYTRSAMSE